MPPKHAHHDGGDDHEKKGAMEKLKEKLPGKKNDDNDGPGKRDDDHDGRDRKDHDGPGGRRDHDDGPGRRHDDDGPGRRHDDDGPGRRHDDDGPGRRHDDDGPGRQGGQGRHGGGGGGMGGGQHEQNMSPELKRAIDTARGDREEVRNAPPEAKAQCEEALRNSTAEVVRLGGNERMI